MCFVSSGVLTVEKESERQHDSVHKCLRIAMIYRINQHRDVVYNTDNISEIVSGLESYNGSVVPLRIYTPRGRFIIV